MYFPVALVFSLFFSFTAYSQNITPKKDTFEELPENHGLYYERQDMHQPNSKEREIEIRERIKAGAHPGIVKYSQASITADEFAGIAIKKELCKKLMDFEEIHEAIPMEGNGIVIYFKGFVTETTSKEILYRINEYSIRQMEMKYIMEQ